jgi:transcriptional regulator with XRE-family HTH domain
MTINQRVSDWFKNKIKEGKTQSYFADIWGISKQTIGQYVHDGGSIGIKPIIKILDYDKTINARWLLLGEGEMYETDISKDEKPTQASENNSSYDLLNIKDNVESREIKMLVGELINQLKIKDDQIKFLQHLIEDKLQ